MTFLDRACQQGWIRYWRFWQHYHRYSVEGLEHLDGDDSVLIAGYHGRPIALDMCLLTVAVYDRYGYLPHGIVHRGLEKFPLFKRFTDGCGFVTEDGPAIREAVANGEHIMVTPGSGQEACRSFLDRYRVSWQGRLGYLRLAARYGLSIVPVAAAGADDMYVGLVDAEPLGRLLGVPSRWAFTLWVGLGPFGPYPYSPPFPVQLKQVVGKPIDCWKGRPCSDPPVEELIEVHGYVVAAVQRLLDRARKDYTVFGGIVDGRFAQRGQ
jgi:1-acyl-sn-glycerol-3-phosphate acyltransferase